MPSFMRESSFCSFLTENIKPIHIEVPLTLGDILEFEMPAVSRKRTDETLLYVYKHQNSFPVSAFAHILFLFIFGVLIAYIGMLLLVLSLFNPILFVITLGLEAKYIVWGAKSVRDYKQKIFVKKVRKWLEKENKEFYSRKLIRWIYDADHKNIIVHNLRLCH